MPLPLSFRWPDEFVAAIDKARGDVPRTVFVMRAVEAALGDGEPDSSRVAPESAVGHGPPASPRPSGPSMESVIEAKAKMSGAEDGLPGPTFGLTVDQAHAWFRDPAERVSGGYNAWRSRKERWGRKR